MRNCLRVYEQASGQLINFEKTALTFNPNTLTPTVNDIKSILSVAAVKAHDLYLGLPTFSLRNKRLQFSYIWERVCKTIISWSVKFFSMGGREILIKSVLQAIPSYAMSCFKLPTTLCHRIEQQCAKFWWKCGMTTQEREVCIG